MISPRTRNTLVGLTMVLAIIVLMYGIVLLGKMPVFGGLRPYSITLESANAGGLSNGAKVDLNGVIIGQVDSVALAQDPAGKLLTRIYIQIDGQFNIPSNAFATLGKQTIGTPFVSIHSNDVPAKPLPHDGTAILHANSEESSLIPKSVFDDIHVLKDNLTQSSDSLRHVADDLHKLLQYTTPEQLAKADPNDPNRPVENVSTLIVRLNAIVQGLQPLLTDPKLHDNVRQILQNFADSSAKLKDTLANANTMIGNFGATSTQATSTLATLQKQILSVSQKLADTLDQLQKSTREITEGNGTTGKLINDPRLYNALLDLSKSLQSTASDLDFLVQKWKDEGVNLKLK